MAHQDAVVSNLKEDQPPTYPYNDKPPDYHDFCPRKTVSSPPADIPPPDNTPAVHIPLTSTTITGTSPAVCSSNTTTVIRYPPENIVVIQPPTYNSHLYRTQDQNKEIGCYDILWKILIVLSIIAAVIVPPIGIWACLIALAGHDNKNPKERIQLAIVAVCLCVVVYVSAIVVVITLPLTLLV